MNKLAGGVLKVTCDFIAVFLSRQQLCGIQGPYFMGLTCGIAEPMETRISTIILMAMYIVPNYVRGTHRVPSSLV